MFSFAIVPSISSNLVGVNYSIKRDSNIHVLKINVCRKFKVGVHLLISMQTMLAPPQTHQLVCPAWRSSGNP